MKGFVDGKASTGAGSPSPATGLEKILRDRGATDVFVCGVALDWCVGYTACDAANLGFNTFVVEDACHSFDIESEKLMRSAIADCHVSVVSLPVVKKAFAAQQTKQNARISEFLPSVVAPEKE